MRQAVYLRTQAALDIEERTCKDVEDFLDDDCFVVDEEDDNCELDDDYFVVDEEE